MWRSSSPTSTSAKTTTRRTFSLPKGQDRLMDSVLRVNPRTIVVLETGGPVLMPWLARTAAVLEAWYPGKGGRGDRRHSRRGRSIRRAGCR